MEKKFIPLTSGVLMEYVERGPADGLPVVFLHGVTDSWRSFEHVLPRLPAHVRAFALSARGHGDSSRPAQGYGYADMSGDLLAFLDAMQLRRVGLVGHSMGSLVAQRFAVDHPGRVAALVLVGAFDTLFGDPGVTELFDSAIAPLADPIDATFAREWQTSTVAGAMDARHLDAVVEETLKVPADVWRQAFAGFLQTPDFSGDLRRLAVPSLVVWGDRDAYTPRERQDRLLAVLPGARFVVHEQVGHAPHWENPERFTSDLEAFFELVPRTG
jgi:pimeloyl-ACP methyl ester carboxylesterase